MFQEAPRVPSPPHPQEPPPPQPPLPPMAPGTNIQIRKDYDPKQTRVQAGPTPPDNFLISPITGEKVPRHEFDEHMKISLLDPKWKEQRDRYEAEKKQQESVFASGTVSFAFRDSFSLYTVFDCEFLIVLLTSYNAYLIIGCNR